MILCSCNILVAAEMRRVAEELQRSAPDRPVTPGRVFQSLGARPQCGGCVELVRRTLLQWGFAQTCPEPLASIANETGDGSALQRDSVKWEVV